MWQRIKDWFSAEPVVWVICNKAEPLFLECVVVEDDPNHYFIMERWIRNPVHAYRFTPKQKKEIDRSNKLPPDGYWKRWQPKRQQ